MNEKELHRIEKLGSSQFQQIILVLTTLLYDFGIHLLSDEFSKQEIVATIRNIFKHGNPEYIFYDEKTMDFYGILLDELIINDIEPMENFLGEEDLFLISDVYNLDGKAAYVLDDNYKLSMWLASKITNIHDSCIESFMKIKETPYFIPIIPNTQKEYYYPVKTLTTYDVADLINILNLCDFVAFGITCMYFHSKKTRIIDDKRIILSREELMSIQIFLQDVGRKLGLASTAYYDTETKIVYAIPMIDYDEVDYEPAVKRYLMKQHNVELSKNDFILSEDGLQITFGRLVILSYQN